MALVLLIFIRFTLAEGQNIGWPLLQFNLGLEAGQVAFVSAVLLLSYFFYLYFTIKPPLVDLVHFGRCIFCSFKNCVRTFSLLN